MTVLEGLAELLTAGLDSLLDRPESPEQLLARVVREIEEELPRARRTAAIAIAASRRLSRELEQNRTEANRWKEHARLALAIGREDLARLAFARKIEHEDLAGALADWIAAAQLIKEEARSAVHILQGRLAEVQWKQRAMTAWRELG